jgi:hypothetical protein
MIGWKWFSIAQSQRPGIRILIDQIQRAEEGVQAAFEERHYPVGYWAERWGFSTKTIREWFRDDSGPGILRQPNTGRRSKRDYTTLMIAPSAAARIYLNRTQSPVIN